VAGDEAGWPRPRFVGLDAVHLPVTAHAAEAQQDVERQVAAR
jgi:hypothetical protein